LVQCCNGWYKKIAADAQNLLNRVVATVPAFGDAQSVDDTLSPFV
jgi:hypothetical protein